MNTKIEIDKFSKTIKETLFECTDDIIDAEKKAVDTVTKGGLKELKNNAPIRTGNYKKSLKSTKERETLTEKVNVLHSKKRYRLSHLLENGHATRNGKRTKSVPHFKHAEDYVNKNLEKEVINNIKKLK